jgi:hypothetical protein
MGALNFNGSDLYTVSSIDDEGRNFAVRSTFCVGTAEEDKKPVLCRACAAVSRPFYRRCKSAEDDGWIELPNGVWIRG